MKIQPCNAYKILSSIWKCKNTLSKVYDDNIVGFITKVKCFFDENDKGLIFIWFWNLFLSLSVCIHILGYNINTYKLINYF